jgi:hypothetical protein
MDHEYFEDIITQLRSAAAAAAAIASGEALAAATAAAAAAAAADDDDDDDDLTSLLEQGQPALADDVMGMEDLQGGVMPWLLLLLLLSLLPSLLL